jgi:hypothetical protein
MGFQETFNERVMSAQNRAFGLETTLKHGVITTAAFTATWESREYEVIDNEGFATKLESRDWMFAVAAAVDANGTAFTPRAGDIVAATENGVAAEWEAMPIGTLPACELTDGGYRYRVHTKRVR